MATKNFSKMTTKKLEALLETASDEDRVAIMEVLAKRTEAQAPAAPATQAPVEFEDEEPLTPEQEAALKAAEEQFDAQKENASEAKPEKKPKMTDDERKALVEKLKENINHRCEVVPFNTIDWVPGYIAGVIDDKRSGKVLYAIKTDDGRRIVKVSDSNLLRIKEETVVIEKKPRVREPKERVERPEWTAEIVADEISKVIGNVGKTISFKQYDSVDEEGNKIPVMKSGRIVAITPDKRVQRLLYKVQVLVPTADDPNAYRIVHKMVGADTFTIEDEFDEIGKEINEKYRTRRESIANRVVLTPQDKVTRCEEALAKAEAELKKAQERIELKKRLLEEAKAELNEFLSRRDSAEDPLA